VNGRGTHLLLGAGTLVLCAALVLTWVRGAASRLDETQGQKATAGVAVARAADEGYCSAELKRVLRRVLTSCGLVKGSGGGRGCQPVEAKSVAALSGGDFNALFTPLAERAAIVQFDQDSADLDAGAAALLEKTFGEQRGASYFFVVSRASPEGAAGYNRELSRKRAETVLDHIRSTFKDPDLDQEVGLLWLGAEFAQLDREFCKWHRSRPDSSCSTTELNRSAFVAWIDCRL
jgi:outer membrane protein OmpA-like peptidoglycan-associated protein